MRGFIEVTGFDTSDKLLINVDTIHVVIPPGYVIDEETEGLVSYVAIQFTIGGHAAVAETYDEVKQMIAAATDC
jgi:hypothetical protein